MIVKPEIPLQDRGPSQISAGYAAYIQRKVVCIIATLVVLFLLVIVSATTGAIRIPLGEVLSALVRFDFTGLGRIVWEVRMPRIVAALLVGGGLSICGTVMQSILRNSLASPYTLGISSAAAFGASFAIVFLQAGSSHASSVVINNPSVVSLCAFAFSMLAAFTILLLTSLTRISAQSMVLSGIAISSMFSAGLTLMQYMADSVQLANIISWTFGDLGRSSWGSVLITAVAVVPISWLFFRYRWDFNAMEAGEELAKGLGIRTERVRMLCMVAASLVSAIVVSFFGIIGFVGLLGPHIARQIIGGDHRYLLLASPLVGAVVLLAADTVARVMLAPMVLPVGILTSLLGGPLFIYLLIKGAKS